MINRVRGTQDLLDLNLQNFVLDLLKKHAQSYNFYEIQTPILEYTQLFQHSLGEQTDVVSKEMYTFETHDKESSICLRPEATASTIRAYFENRIENKPWKVFSIGSMFRRERPQKGRWREFTQVNFEVINSDSVAQDVLFIKMLDSFFAEKLKFNNYILKLNYLGSLEDRKRHRVALDNYLNKHLDEICETCKTRKDTNILRVFDCKNKTCQNIYKDAPKLTDFLSEQSLAEWNKLQEMLHILSINFILDPKLVRGLDYYNKVVFEFSSDDLGAQNAFCGGGHYSLGKELGSKENFSSIGAAIGLGRLLLLVEQNINQINIKQLPPLYLILPMSEEQHELALLLANELHYKNLTVDILLEGNSIKSMMRKANKLGAKKVLILGEDEQNNGTVTVKNMQTGESQIIEQVDVFDIL